MAWCEEHDNPTSMCDEYEHREAREERRSRERVAAALRAKHFNCSGPCCHPELYAPGGPKGSRITNNPSEMSAAALDAGATSEMLRSTTMSSVFAAPYGKKICGFTVQPSPGVCHVPEDDSIHHDPYTPFYHEYGGNKKPSIYVASRASIPERACMWRLLRDTCGVNIISSWIDQDGEGASDYGQLWPNIIAEIAASTALILYVEFEDFPLKGAFVEVGVALALNKRVFVVAPGVFVEERSYRPIGSWMNHPLVKRMNTIKEAVEEIQKPLHL